jgi:hypothetical protein
MSWFSAQTEHEWRARVEDPPLEFSACLSVNVAVALKSTKKRYERWPCHPMDELSEVEDQIEL